MAHDSDDEKKTTLYERNQAEEPALGTVIADRYRLTRRLGAGGMGAVYKAEHVTLRRPVAVKLLHRFVRADREVVARFEREALAAANIDHPNVAQAYDSGRLPDGTPYLVMEYVEGTTLAGVLRESPALPPARALKILRQIAGALTRAHALGVVHRDVKPDNIVLCSRDGDEDFVKVIDFGIARIGQGALNSGGAALTQQGMVFGTPAYLSPEQCLGQRVDGRADQYALGVVAFQMLTGRKPYDADDAVTLLQQHLTAPVPRASEFAPALSSEVDAVLARMLAKRPSERFDSVDAAIQALGVAAGSTTTGPVVAPPGALPYDATQRALKRPKGAPADDSDWKGAAPTTAGPAPGSFRPVAPASRLRAVLGLFAFAALVGAAGFGLWKLRHRAPQPRGIAPSTVVDAGVADAALAEAPSADAANTSSQAPLVARGPCSDGRCACRNARRCAFTCADEPCDGRCENMVECAGRCGDHCTLHCNKGQRCDLRCDGDCHAACSDVRDCRVQCTDRCQVDCSTMMNCVVRMISGQVDCAEQVGRCDVQCVVPGGGTERATRCGRGRYRCPPGPC